VGESGLLILFSYVVENTFSTFNLFSSSTIEVPFSVHWLVESILLCIFQATAEP